MDIKKNTEENTSLAIYVEKEDIVAKICNVLLKAKYKTTLLEQNYIKKPVNPVLSRLCGFF